MGKWAVFTVAFSAGAWPVVLVAILSSIISVFFYVRLILVLFFQGEMPEEKQLAGDSGGGVATATRTELATVTKPSLATTGVIAVSAALTLLLGVVPGPVLDLLADAGQFIR
jgi:NADH-quinone oxidoreductase subunit N